MEDFPKTYLLESETESIKKNRKKLIRKAKIIFYDISNENVNSLTHARGIIADIKSQ